MLTSDTAVNEWESNGQLCEHSREGSADKEIARHEETSKGWSLRRLLVSGSRGEDALRGIRT